MKKICLALALCFAVATPAYACPHSEGDAKTAKADKDKKADKTAKDSTQKDAPKQAPKKADDKVSMK